MNTETLVEPEMVTDRRLRLFSLYVDFAAAGRVRWATRQISRLAGEHWKFSAEMWNLDSLTASESVRKMIAQDAVRADVLVIAMSSLDRREAGLFQWLDSLAAGKASPSGSGLFIGLLGDDNNQAGELDWTVKQFLRCAQRADRDFIWRWMEREAMDSAEWLEDSVAALLVRKQPAPEAHFWQEAVPGVV
jgi:hypothetical protein